METSDKKKTSDVLSEKAIWIRVGFLFFRLRPVTLSQIYEMGVIANDLNIDGINMDKKIRVFAETLAHYNDARIMQRIFIVCLFRSAFMRFLFGWYIRHHLTLREYEKLIMYESISFNINFFLTSLIFLKRTVKITEPTQTIAHGQQSEVL